MAETFINIRFPFYNSPKGYFLEMTKTNKRAIEPNIVTVQTDIKSEIQRAVDRYIPNLKIDRLEVIPTNNNEHSVTVKIEYTVTNNTFTESDFISIDF